MTTNKIFLPILFVGVSIGIILAEIFNLGLFFTLFLILIALGVGMAIFALRAEKGTSVFIAVSLVLLLSMSLGVFISTRTVKEFHLREFSGERVRIYGEVVEEPQDRGSYLLLIVLTEAVETPETCETLSERVMVRSDRFANVQYGDKVSVEGRVDLPEPFITETDRIFAYDEFLQKDSIGTIVSFAQTKVIETGGGSAINRALFGVKSAYLKSIKRFIPDPEVSLLGGLTVGTKQSLGKELERDFRVTGIIHIVVLSGYNVVIIAEAIMFVLRYFSTKVRTFLGVVAIALFAILVGGGATVVRAAVMASVALLARAFGRESLAFQALFFAGTVMLIFNPLLLLHDPSFQLSFLATLGLIVLSERFERIFSWIGNKGFRDIVTATVSVQIAVLPFLLFSIGELSIVALPVNLLVLASVPIAMLLGFLTGLFGLIPIVSGLLAPIFGILAFLVLRYELLVIDIFARLPFAAVTLPQFSFFLVILVYAFMGFVLLKTNPARVSRAG